MISAKVMHAAKYWLYAQHLLNGYFECVPCLFIHHISLDTSCLLMLCSLILWCLHVSNQDLNVVNGSKGVMAGVWGQWRKRMTEVKRRVRNSIVRVLENAKGWTLFHWGETFCLSLMCLPILTVRSLSLCFSYNTKDLLISLKKKEKKQVLKFVNLVVFMPVVSH